MDKNRPTTTIIVRGGMYSVADKKKQKFREDKAHKANDAWLYDDMIG